MRHSSRQQEWGQWMPNSQSAYLSGKQWVPVARCDRNARVDHQDSCHRGGDRVGVSEIDDAAGSGRVCQVASGHSASRFVVPRD